MLCRHAIHAEIGWFREDLPVVGDWEPWLRLALTDHTLGFVEARWRYRRLKKRLHGEPAG